MRLRVLGACIHAIMVATGRITAHFMALDTKQAGQAIPEPKFQKRTSRKCATPYRMVPPASSRSPNACATAAYHRTPIVTDQRPVGCAFIAFFLILTW